MKKVSEPKMVKIYKPYGEEKPERKPTPAGKTEEPVFKERYDENGVAYLVQTGVINTYEKIQSYKDECDINAILARYANGDESALAMPAYYIDTTRLPTSYTEWLNKRNELQERFNSLPLNIREKFGMDFNQWAAAAGTESWFNRMGYNAKTTENQQNGENSESSRKENTAE